uniref:RRM domain-containing protein n=1 Tax=Eutreptiella gymnastica TaxID=73025 RepID=A0A7S1J235_9EUGL
MTQSTKILVSQLPLGTTTTAMRALFEACGDVLEVLILGASHEGTNGHIVYREEEAARRAVHAFHLQPLLGGRVQVVQEGTPQEVKVFVGNLPGSTTQGDLQTLFSPFGELTECVLLAPKKNQTTDNRCGFVKFADGSCAEQAIQSLNSQEYGGCHIVVRMADTGVKSKYGMPTPPVNMLAPSGAPIPQAPAAPNTYTPAAPQPAAAGAASGGKLFVGNMPKSWDQERMKTMFQPYGPTSEVVILNKRGLNDSQCGFVRYQEPLHAHAALQTLNNHPLEDGTLLVVRMADAGKGGGGAMRGQRGGQAQAAPYRPY